MAVQAGASSKLNIVAGYSTTVHISDSDKTRYAETVYRAGILLHDDQYKLYHTDGVKSLKQILEHPIVDGSQEVLTAKEREMIKNYNKVNGFVASDELNKIDDVHLKPVEDGHIKDSYLSKYVENGKIKLDALPAEARAFIKYVATYDQLENVPQEERKGMVFVIDASGDKTVGKGWAIYVYAKKKGDVIIPFAGDAEGEKFEWVKVQEGEGIDFDYDSLTTHDTVEKVGAVMYDHVVCLQSPTLDQLASLADPVVAPVFTNFPTTFSIYDKTDTNLGLKITEQYATEGDHTVVMTITDDDAANATLTVKGFDEGELNKDTEGKSKTITGTSAKELNTKLAKLTVNPGATGGELTIVLDDYDTKKITVTKKAFIAPSIQKVDPIKAIPSKETDFAVQLSTEGVDPDATYTVTITPKEGVTMKNHSNGDVTESAPWTISSSTVAIINPLLKQGKVISDTDGGSVSVVITDGASTDINVVATWKDPAFQGQDKVVAADTVEVALGMTLTTEDIDVAAQHTLVITSDKLTMKNDTEEVASGKPITFTKQTVEKLNEALGKVKVIGKTGGGKVSLKLDNKPAKVITVAES